MIHKHTEKYHPFLAYTGFIKPLTSAKSGPNPGLGTQSIRFQSTCSSSSSSSSQLFIAETSSEVSAQRGCLCYSTSVVGDSSQGERAEEVVLHVELRTSIVCVWKESRLERQASASPVCLDLLSSRRKCWNRFQKWLKPQHTKQNQHFSI